MERLIRNRGTERRYEVTNCRNGEKLDGGEKEKGDKIAYIGIGGKERVADVK